MSLVDINWNSGMNAPTHAGGTSGRMVAAMVVSAGALISGGANASVVAGWNMNGVDPTTALTLNASVGNGVLDFTAFGDNSSVLLGTAVGALKGDLAGNALSVAGNAFNGVSLVFSFETTGFQDLTLSLATRRSTTGFALNRIEYWNGLGWSTAASFGASTTAWELKSFDLSAIDAIENGFATLRITLDGATGATGSIRFDNVTFCTSAIPTPGALALLGLASLAARRRRS